MGLHKFQNQKENVNEVNVERTPATEPNVEENVDKQLVVDINGKRIKDELANDVSEQVVAGLLERIQIIEREWSVELVKYARKINRFSQNIPEFNKKTRSRKSKKKK